MVQDRDTLRENATQKFLSFMENHGGFFDKSQALSFTTMSETELDALVLERKALKINIHGNECFPAFQFKEHSKETWIQEVLPLVPDNIGPAHICSFLLSQSMVPLAPMGGTNLIDLLRDNPSQSELDFIKREASTLGFMGR